MGANLLILGAGGHGQSVLDVVLATGAWECIAFLDDDPTKDTVYGCPVLGPLEEYEKHCDTYPHAMVALGNNTARISWLHKLKVSGFQLPTVIHPNAWVGSHVTIGEGCVLMPGVCVNIGSVLGNGCILNTGGTIDHHNYLEAGVHISPGAHTGGRVRIGQCTWICMGASIGNNVKIAENCIIAAGAAVVQDIKEPGTYAGVPAKKKEGLRMMREKIYLSPPYMCGNEMKYIQQAFDENWIAPLGPNVTAFEQEMAAYIGMKHAVATNGGTAAIHLALMYLGVGRGDVVFCSDLTFAGSCNPICYLGAEPVFIDSEEDSYNMSSSALEDAFKWAKANNKLPKAVIVVDLYGQSADFDELLPICAQYGVPVIEDAAEAVGASYQGKKCGSFGHINILSFNGNKIINTSGGGMALSDDDTAIKKMLFWGTQAREAEVHYEHREIGYNYRLSNVCAGIGRGQLEGLPFKLKRRKEIYENYCALFADSDIKMMPILEKGESNYWLSIALLPEGVTPGAVCAALARENIEARPAWKPMHAQPVFKGRRYFGHEGGSVGMGLFGRGVCLPSGEGLDAETQKYIANLIK